MSDICPCAECAYNLGERMEAMKVVVDGAPGTCQLMGRITVHCIIWGPVTTWFGDTQVMKSCEDRAEVRDQGVEGIGGPRHRGEGMISPQDLQWMLYQVVREATMRVEATDDPEAAKVAEQISDVNIILGTENALELRMLDGTEYRITIRRN